MAQCKLCGAIIEDRDVYIGIDGLPYCSICIHLINGGLDNDMLDYD